MFREEIKMTVKIISKCSRSFSISLVNSFFHLYSKTSNRIELSTYVIHQSIFRIEAERKSWMLRVELDDSKGEGDVPLQQQATNTNDTELLHR